MIIVVEIVSRAGTRACKEYDAPSYNAAIEAVKRELAQHTPRFALQTSGSKTIAWSSENQWTTGELCRSTERNCRGWLNRSRFLSASAQRGYGDALHLDLLRRSAEAPDD